MEVLFRKIADIIDDLFETQVCDAPYTKLDELEDLINELQTKVKKLHNDTNP